jgi:PAS domain-containing protein
MAAGNLEIVGALMDVTENICLYRDLAEREAKIRRLVDSNIIGIFMWEAEGRIFEANDARTSRQARFNDFYGGWSCKRSR